MDKNVGFISTRFAGIDGVSLEASKWEQVLARNGHNCFWLAGELDRDPRKSLLVPEAHFQHSQIQWLNAQVFGHKSVPLPVFKLVAELKSVLKTQLEKFAVQFDLDLLIVENALSIPLNIPLAAALTEFISETKIPTIAHHHDFYWERDRFEVNGIGDYLKRYFPPNLPNLSHVVINSTVREDLAARKRILATSIPNVLDFENPPAPAKNGFEKFHSTFSLNPSDRVVLQPTRVIRRKGIEHAIELVKALDNHQYKLVISHDSGDEGHDYAETLYSLADAKGVALHVPTKSIRSPWLYSSMNGNGFNLWNVYPAAEFVTFPSLYEGFGNALLEAVYFKKPILINRYEAFVRDIEPKGFDFIKMNGRMTTHTVTAVKQILKSPERRSYMVNRNYEIARRHYSYSSLEKRLNYLIRKAFNAPENSAAEVRQDCRNTRAPSRDRLKLRKVAV